MAEWTGTWKDTPHIKCECKCGQKDGAETWRKIFDAEELAAMCHDGEERNFIRYFCDTCIAKYGSGIIEF